jgi:two-component system nitrate/nitrite response regulator NarL
MTDQQYSIPIDPTVFTDHQAPIPVPSGPSQVDILICDDHGMFAGGLADALSGTGSDVVATTSDPDQVGRLVEDLRPEVFLMGARYSGVERLDVLPHVRKASPGTSLMLLASASTSVWDAFDSGQVAAVVTKQCTFATIERSLERVRRGERFTLGIDRPSVNRTPTGDVPLTPRERDVLREMVAGATTSEMSRALDISVNTVRTHVQHVLDKLGVGTRVQAAQLAVERRLLDPDEGEQV